MKLKLMNKKWKKKIYLMKIVRMRKICTMMTLTKIQLFKIFKVEFQGLLIMIKITRTKKKNQIYNKY